MDEVIGKKILALLDEHRIMTSRRCGRTAGRRQRPSAT